MISALDAETSALARSFRRHRRGVFGDIGDCGVGITPQMCNRVTNHADMSTFSKQAWDHVRGDIDDPCGAIADFCGVIAIPEAIDGRAGTDAATPIVARLVKHHKT